MSALGGQGIRIENDNSQELIAPIIPVRPNTTIPVLMGLLLVLGGILVMFMGYAEISRQGEPNLPKSEERQLEQGFSQSSNVTGEDIQDLHDELRHGKYYWYLRVATLLSCSAGTWMRSLRSTATGSCGSVGST